MIIIFEYILLEVKKYPFTIAFNVRSRSRRPGQTSLLLPRRGALVVLSCFKVLDSLFVLEIYQSHGDHGVPAVVLRGTPEIDLLIVHSNDGEVDKLPGTLHTVHFLDGLKFHLFALGALLCVRVDVQAVRSQHARFPFPELEKVVAPLLQLSLFQDLGYLLR